MARYDRAGLIVNVMSRFNDNTTGQITPERARAMFIDIIDSFYSISDDNIDPHYRGVWNADNTLPTSGGSGAGGSLKQYDRWVITDADGWDYSSFHGAQWTIIEAMIDGAVNFEDFKIY